MNQNQLRCLAAVLCFFLFISCKTKQVAVENSFLPDHPNAHTQISGKISHAESPSSPKAGPQFTGREVPFTLAVPCFQRYEEMMNKHAFVTNPKGAVSIKVNEEPITTSVSYDGVAMVDWMQRMLKFFPGTDPGDIGFLMMPGHLDEEFLKAVKEDPANWPYKLNRTSIFIVPVKKSEGATIKQFMSAIRSGFISSTFQNRPPVYELGGVQP